MDGFCDVPGCTNETFMGWRPLTERLGKQICEAHWLRHKDARDSFNLFDAFGFKRPAKRPTRPVQTGPSRYDCDRALPPTKPVIQPAQERKERAHDESKSERKPSQEKPDRREPEKAGPQIIPATSLRSRPAVGRAVRSGKPGIGTAQVVPNNTGRPPAGRPKAAIGESSISLVAQTDISAPELPDPSLDSLPG